METLVNYKMQHTHNTATMAVAAACRAAAAHRSGGERLNSFHFTPSRSRSVATAILTFLSLSSGSSGTVVVKVARMHPSM